jgi:oligopeptide transport system permease protein
MFSYIIRRLLGVIPTLFLIIAISFFMVRLAPGGPFSSERRLPAEIEANLMAKYHLNDPLYVQFFTYLGNILHGDFGPSFKYKDFSVNDLIWQGFPVSLQLGMGAMLFALGFGCLIGVIAALRQNSLTDYSLMGGALLGIAIPNFVLAPLLTLIFGVYLGILPVAGWGSWQQMILPIFALGLKYVAYAARLTRASVLEVIRSNYVRTARAKGLPEYLVIWRHTLRAAMLPVVSFAGPTAAFLITGSLVIEVIFQLPGIGRYFIQGALNRDYTLVIGVVIFLGFIIILFNLIADLLYGLLDPRVRYD